MKIHLLPCGKPEAMPNGLLDSAPTTMYWQNLCQSIQLSADCGNIRAMYEGMKKAFGTCAIKIAPLKSTSGEIITDRTKQMERWAEHYQELYSRETIVTETAVENTSPLPVMEELDDPPTTEKLDKAIDSLVSGKAPGNDGIPPKSSKQAKRPPSSSTSMNSYYSAGRKEVCHWICAMPISSRCTRTKAIAAIVTTIAAYPSSALSGRLSPASYSTDCSYLLSECTQRRSVGSNQSDQRLPT